MESNAIRLTNRTAIALRRQAKRTRNAYFVMGAVGTLLLLALAVYLGMMWLPAVPLLLALAVATDALLALSARRMYLQLIGQAICTEAAARRIRAEKSEKQRRRQAVDDLVAMQRDAQRQTEAILPTRWGRRAACRSSSPRPSPRRRAATAAAGRRASPSLRMIPPNRCSEEP